MLPGAYEFRWDAAHVVFLGAFFTMLLALAACLLMSLWRSWRDLRAGRTEQLRWHGDFASLPEACRLCRHTLRGAARQRVCNQGFDCDTCSGHPSLRCLPPPTTRSMPPDSASRDHTVETPAAARSDPEDIVFGLRVPRDRYYDRGHTWVQVLQNGRLRIGLDALTQKLLGKPERLDLPRRGARLRRHGSMCRFWKHGSDLHLRSPVEGMVCDVGGPEEDWILEVEPPQNRYDLTHLLHDDEVRAWMQHEVERFVGGLGGDGLGTCLTDGGELQVDPERLDPQHDPRPVWDDLFLQA